MTEYKESPAGYIISLLDGSNNTSIKKFSEFIRTYDKAPVCYYLKEAAMQLSEGSCIQFFSILSKAEEFRLRYEVAFCKYTPDSILQKLVKDENKNVRAGYFSNQKTIKSLDKFLHN